MTSRTSNVSSPSNAAALAEAQRRAAEEAARKAAEAEAARKAAAEAARQQPQAPSDGYDKGKGALPKQPSDLEKMFPDLKGKKPDDLKKIYDNLVKLKTGTPSEQLAAAGDLVKTFPKSLDKALEQVGLKDTKIGKLVKDPEAFKALGTLVSEKATDADKAKAALALATSAGKAFAPKDLDGFLKKALGAGPAAQKLVDAVTAFTDPSKSALDKGKAAFALAQSVKDFAGKEFPKIADDLRKLDGTFKAVGSALTLVDPKADTKDKALAAAQLAVEIPDLKKDLSAFKDFLKSQGVKDADTLADSAVKLADTGVKGLTPELAQKLSPAQLETVKKLAGNADLKDALPKILERATDPKQLDEILAKVGSMDGKSGKALLETLGGLERDVMQKALAKTVDGKPMLEVLGELATKLPEKSKGSLAKVVARFDENALAKLAEVGTKVDGKAVGELLKVAEKSDSKLVGKALVGTAELLEKMGLKMTGEAALKLLKGVGKIIPVAGAAVSGIDAAKMYAEAANTKLPPDLRFFALTAGNLNAADTVLGVIEATGVGNVDLPIQIGLGAAEVAMDIAFSSEKAKFEADPANYKAPMWMKAVNVGAAAAQGPMGMAQLAGIYGPEGAAVLVQDMAKAGAKGAIKLAEMAGVAQADAVGAQMKLTAAGMHALADVIRNPSKYGAKAKELVQNAAQQLGEVIQKGGELAKEAKQALSNAVDTLKAAGEKGLQTLSWIAQNPGEAASIAVNGIKSMIEGGIDLTKAGAKALYQKAVDTLGDLKEGWQNLKGAAREKAKELIDTAGKAIDAGLKRAVELGEKAVDMVAWAATHPGEVGRMAKEKIGVLLSKGGELAKKTWDEVVKLGGQARDIAESAVRGLKNAGEAAVDTLKYIAEHPGEAGKKALTWVGETLTDLAKGTGEAAKKAATAVKEFVDRRAEWAISTAKELLTDGVASFKEVAKAWKTNLTEGGKALLDGLKDLGDAGVDALKDLATIGGQLAQGAVDRLSNLARAGSRLATDAVKKLADFGGEVANVAKQAWGGLKSITNGEFEVYGFKVDLNPLW
ncbi:MAG: Dauer Up-regulated [Myxococcota bacterium]